MKTQMKHIAPGVYEDAAGAVHFSVPELMEHLHIEDTAENREQLSREMEDFLREFLPAAKVVIQD
jgi:hypothetical protein